MTYQVTYLVRPYVVAVLWDVQGECKNYNVLSGHKNAVLQLEWTHDGSKVRAVLHCRTTVVT